MQKVVWHSPPSILNWLYHHIRHEDGGPDEINLDGLSGVPADVLAIADIDDSPVDGATTHPISSNWASQHEQKYYIMEKIIKSMLRFMLVELEWDGLGLDDIDLEEWLE